MIARLIAVFVFAVFLAGAGHADKRADIDELITLMQFPETIEIINQEGIVYGKAIAEDMLSGVDTKNWDAAVAKIYNPVTVLALVRKGFDKELTYTDLKQLLEYYRSDAGREVVELEVAARRAFLDSEVEETALERLKTLEAEKAAILDHVQVLIDDSDLINLNVMGAMNSNLMFYKGLYEGARQGGRAQIPEDEMLADVWAQEADIREESISWLRSYMVMAYDPLTSEQIEEYAAFYRTKEGRDLNRALFAGFDVMYDQISYELGLAVASFMTSEPL